MSKQTKAVLIAHRSIAVRHVYRFGDVSDAIRRIGHFCPVSAFHVIFPEYAFCIGHAVRVSCQMHACMGLHLQEQSLQKAIHVVMI